MTAATILPAARVRAALASPGELARRLPCDGAAAATVARGRDELAAVLEGRDERLVALVGPCSLHDRGATLDYAQRLRAFARAHDDALLVVMRTYVEKPRSTVGWKGLVNDPHLDGSCDVATGLARAREWLLAVAALGLPCASELLDPIAARYVEDVLSWGGIGARTAESQTHRELASGFPAPVGIKNGTQGDLQGALDAVVAARAVHVALRVDERGRAVAARTPGNPHAHVVLRGGTCGPNHDEASIERAARALGTAPLQRPVIVDCSHGNSGKDPGRQAAVLDSLLARLGSAGGPPHALAGFCLESHLRGGRQPWSPGAPMRPDVSLTDACLGWDATEPLLHSAAEAVRRSRRSRRPGAARG